MSLLYGVGGVIAGMVAVAFMIRAGRPRKHRNDPQRSSFGLATGAAPWWKNGRGPER